MKMHKIKHIVLTAFLALSALSIVLRASAQGIAWGPATGITGDANLAVGIYYDAFLPNTVTPAPLTVDAVTFNVDTIVSGTSTSDGTMRSIITTAPAFRRHHLLHQHSRLG